MSGPKRQHLIDPELCIRCNTCEETCPAGAITHDYNNYVVDASTCNACLDCIQPCPTGAIDSWRLVPADAAYSTDAQLTWTALPGELPASTLGGTPPEPAHHRSASDSAIAVVEQLYGRSAPARGRVVENLRVTAPDGDTDIHHLTLDLSSQPFPVLEGQSIGILAPGTDDEGRPHAMRLYSVASPRGGERGQAGHVALTVKRALGGLCSNYLCDLPVGTSLDVLGPFGVDFLMPADDTTPLVMICTGTGVAPMRAMILQRLHQGGRGALHLFYGSRQAHETAYAQALGELAVQHPDQLALHLAYSRVPGQPKQYVQDTLRQQHDTIATLLRHGSSVFYLCGLKGMEDGVFAAFDAICQQHGLDWAALKPLLGKQARLHIETY